MPTSIFLPAAEEVEVCIKFKDGTVTADIFDLEQLFVDAEYKANEMGTTWKDEFVRLFKNRYKKEISKGQAVLLWDGIRNNIAALKKSLLTDSDDFSKQESPSPRKRKKKSG